MEIIKYCFKEKLFFTITNLCDRLSLNKYVLILAVGHADKGAKVPLAATIKKNIQQMLTVLQ